MNESGRSIAVAIILAAALAAVWVRSTPPSPLGPAAPDGAFSAGRALDAFRATIGGTVPHPVESNANQAVRDRIVARFRSLGYETRIDRTFACSAYGTCANVENIVASLPGANPTQPAVLAVAHYDSVPAGPGASDDGIGAASLLEIARAVRGEQHRNPIVFLVDDGEEAGLLGAEGFVARRAAQPQVAAVVNVEARGTSGPSFLFETSSDSGWFLPQVTKRIPRPITSSLFATIYDLLPNDTDLTVFKRAGFSGVNFAFAGDVSNYHTPSDDIGHLDLGSVQHQGENALAALRGFADADFTKRQPGAAVWFDVLGFFVVAWPARATLVIAIVSMLAACLAAARFATRRDILLGLVTFVLTVAATGGIAWAAALVARGHAHWLAHPQASLIAMWIVGLAVPVAIVAFFRNANFFAGHTIAWNALAITTAATLPGPSYLFVVPAVVLSLALVARAIGPKSELVGGLAAAAVAAILWFPLTIRLYPLLGATSLTFIAVCVAVVATTFTPLRLRLPAELWLGAAVILISCLAAAMAFAPYDPAHPQRVNIVYYDDGSEPRWLVSDATPALRRVVEFKGRTTIAPWLRQPGKYFAAPAPVLPIAPVMITREGSVLHVRSQRQADRVALMIHSPVGKLLVNGVPLPPRPLRFHDALAPGWTRLVSRGAAMDVDTGTTAALDVVASDTAFGAPAAAAPLVAARKGSHGIPSDDGDVTVTVRHERF